MEFNVDYFLSQQIFQIVLAKGGKSASQLTYHVSGQNNSNDLLNLCYLPKQRRLGGIVGGRGDGSRTPVASGENTAKKEGWTHLASQRLPRGRGSVFHFQ